MKKLFNIFIVFLLGFVFTGVNNQVFALGNCTSTYSGFSISNFHPDYGSIFIQDKVGIVHAQVSGLTPNKSFTAICEEGYGDWTSAVGWPDRASFSMTSDSSGNAQLDINNTACWSDNNNYRIKIIETSSGNECLGISYNVEKPDTIYCDAKSAVIQTDGCYLDYSFTVLNGDGTAFSGKVMTRSDGVLNGMAGAGRIQSSSDGVISGEDAIAYSYKEMLYNLYATNGSGEPNVGDLIASCQLIAGTSGNIENCKSISEYHGNEPFSLCKQIPDDPQFDEQRQACLDCTNVDEHDRELNNGVWTAIGCINRNPQSMMQSLISVGLGMSGGVALLTFLAAGFIFSTSQGDPKAYGKAKEMMTASIVGIIFIIFSVTMLQFIGYEIFKIPGFGG